MKNNVDEIVFNGVTNLLNNNSWTGTMTDLKTCLNKRLNKEQRTLLPGSPGALRVVLNRVINRIRNKGISVKFARTNDHARTRYVKFTH